MQSSIDFKKLESNFRQYGIEGEDIFYAISATYLDKYIPLVSGRLNNIRRKGLEIQKRIETDQKLKNAIKKLVESDPIGQHLPNIWA